VEREDVHLIKVLVLLIRFTNLLLILASTTFPPPNAGSELEVDHPTVIIGLSV